MAVLLKTTSLRVSFIQIMQVRVQNKGKSVWKSRYVGDVSLLHEDEFPALKSGFDILKDFIVSRYPNGP